MCKLSTELIYNIFEYLPYGTECAVNKEFYHHIKQRTIKDFYDAPITDTSCGHKHNTIKVLWVEQIGWDEYESRIVQTRRMYLCPLCFSYNLLSFIKYFKHVPYLRGNGESFIQRVKYFRFSKNKPTPMGTYLSGRDPKYILEPNNLLRFLCSDLYKDFIRITKDLTVFDISYYKKEANEDLLLEESFTRQYLLNMNKQQYQPCKRLLKFG